MAIEDKSSVLCEIGFGNCEAVYFCESEQSLKFWWDEHKRPLKDCDSQKIGIIKHLGNFEKTGEEIKKF